MKLFTALLALTFSATATMAQQEMPSDRNLMSRQTTEESIEDPAEYVLSDYDIEALFEQDMAEGVTIMHGDPAYDEDSEDEGGRALRGGARTLQSDNYVLLCKHSECTGGHFWAAPGWYPSMPWEIGNDQLTRAYIPAGYTFTYYEHGNFQGWQASFGESNSRINLFMGGHNDAVSSFVVRKFN